MNRILLLIPAAIFSSGCDTKVKPSPPVASGLFRTRSVPVPPWMAKYPVAQAVDHRPGFVVSPYSGRIVDVSSVRSGGMAADPSITWAKRYFRVP